MNALQLAPLGVKTTPPVPTGERPPVGEASSTSNKSTRPAQLPAVATHAEQQQRLAEARANTARATAERKAQAEAAAEESQPTPALVNTFDRKVGLVDGTFKVFVDLVKPPHDEPVVRVFGPPENPVPQEAQPRTAAAGASSAYARAANSLPLKDLGVV